jgi:hypothetical protein
MVLLVVGTPKIDGEIFVVGGNIAPGPGFDQIMMLIQDCHRPVALSQATDAFGALSIALKLREHSV